MEEIKLCLFTDDMIIYVENPNIYIENPKESTQTLLELLNNHSKLAGYKVNRQKTILPAMSNSEVKITRSIMLASRTKIKYLGIYLSKYVQYL